MYRSIEMRVLAAAAGALILFAQGAARAQDVPALCARVINDDRVRPIPITLVPKARELFSFSSQAADAYIQKGTSFRCMEGKVWLCNTGANLVCGKADTSRISAGASAFCKDNPGADVVPMAATGHGTIYEWKCDGKNAVIAKEAMAVDGRGFLSANWKPLD